MASLLKIIILAIIALILFGYYTESTNGNGKLYIGIGVLVFAFVLMPLFIYHRYNNRIGDFIDSRMEKEEKTND